MRFLLTVRSNPVSAVLTSLPSNFRTLVSAVAGLLLVTATELAATEPPPLTGPLMENFTFLDEAAPAPQEAFTDIQGRILTLADFHGKVLLINFWATWCAPCIREMPSLDRLQASLEDKPAVVLAISQDRGGARVVEPFYRDLELLSLDIYLDPKGKLARAFGVRGLPTTMLVDAEGRLVGGLQGLAEWDSPEVRALIEHYMPDPVDDEAPVQTQAPASDPQG